MKSSQILSFALAFASLSSASLLDKPEFSDALAGFEGFFRRQDDNDKSATTSAPPSSSTSSDNKDNKDSSASASDQASNSATGKGSSATASGSGKNSASGGTKTTSKPKTTAFDPRLPAGGVSMITPAAISGQQYYKIGDWVTFAWNYTSLSVTPTAIDVLATCTKNQATYTLAVNQTVGNSTGYVLWDTGAYQSTATVPLLTETYTLLIFDADSSVSATAAAGYLAVQSGHSFGMYTPQPYTPWADYRCPTCNSGSTLSATERQTLGFLFAMGTITVLSFTWFANGFGLF